MLSLSAVVASTAGLTLFNRVMGSYRIIQRLLCGLHMGVVRIEEYASAISGIR